MEFNEELIEELRKGEIAVVNPVGGNVELLKCILKEAFPDDEDEFNDFTEVLKISNVFYASDEYKGEWTYYDSTNPLRKKIKQVSDFIVPVGEISKKMNEEFNTTTSSFKNILDSIGEMLEAKDKAYGNSALKPLDIFAKHHNYGSRLDEKLARVKNSEELRKNDVADLIGGLILICRDKGWTDFKDQIN